MAMIMEVILVVIYELVCIKHKAIISAEKTLKIRYKI
jgi:hypothetical protein